ncbi:hypothetical protein [Jannaschia pohangensis]|uniref:Animal haem peroxidase n=1 Tax=Jannaschia pohangensis TaxID=390807 RepID=A0A1I3S006_9RHOB|nr:hypothetical protein [Jannaschia pohangensis]SFJ50881.1 hypothetical protein SAMN04488095_2931 [Jannaschia pohangensis]
MAKSQSPAAHGMVSGITVAIKYACHDMQKGTQTLQGWEKVHAGTEQAAQMRAQQTFGRLFDAQALNTQPTADQIKQLAQGMAEGPDDPQDGPADAGTAFFGQFIDHDLTLDATTMLGAASGDVAAVPNFRTPRFDLDSVLGHGPEVDPWLYGQGGRSHALVFGSADGAGVNANPLDLQRNRNARALIGDPRNDENLFISQIHGRQFVDAFNGHIETHGNAFEPAADDLRHAYQRRVCEEFLPQVVAEDVLSPLLSQARHGSLKGPINWDCAPDMPVEFAAAAFRFGHSMIRQSYSLNDRFPDVELFSEAHRGFSPVPEWFNLDFDRFFGPSAQKSRPINTKLVADLINLPGRIVPDTPNLAERNMLRGQHTFCLPSGERAAASLGFDVLDPHDDIKALGLTGNTPLWFYILWEAECAGGKLGQLGGTLVAGTLLNLMLRDSNSIFNSGESDSLAA